VIARLRFRFRPNGLSNIVVQPASVLATLLANIVGGEVTHKGGRGRIIDSSARLALARRPHNSREQLGGVTCALERR
jgi:hypothetical protein